MLLAFQTSGSPAVAVVSVWPMSRTGQLEGQETVQVHATGSPVSTSAVALFNRHSQGTGVCSAGWFVNGNEGKKNPSCMG